MTTSSPQNDQEESLTNPPISQNAHGSDIAMAAGSGAKASIVKADFKGVLNLIITAILIPFIFLTLWLTIISDPILAALIFFCLRVIPLGTLVASIFLKSWRNIILSVIAIAIVFEWIF